MLIVAMFAMCLGLASLAQAANLNSDSSQQTITLSVTSTISLTLATTTVNLGELTPGTPISADSSLQVTTNDEEGWNLQVKRDDAASTLNKNGAAAPDVQFPDAIAWNYSFPNATTTPGANLSFHVLSTTDAALYDSGLWGIDDGANALYAGFPSTNQEIAGTATYVAGAQTVNYRLQADAPSTQYSGPYSGTITMTALTNP